jgi:tetratricopeptide (TPR) repeat protein
MHMTYVDKGTEEGWLAAIELIELCSEWLLSAQTTLPPDELAAAIGSSPSSSSSSSVPELPTAVAMIYAISKLHLDDDKEAAVAIRLLKPILQAVDQKEVLSHLLIGDDGGDNDGDDDDALDRQMAYEYSVEELLHDMMLLRQFMRTALQLIAIGMHTRASKLLAFITQCLTTLCSQELVSNNSTGMKKRPNSLSIILTHPDLSNTHQMTVPRILCQLANAWESLSQVDEAIAAYHLALSVNPSHVLSLREYARVVGQHGERYADLSGRVLTLLGDLCIMMVMRRRKGRRRITVMMMF